MAARAETYDLGSRYDLTVVRKDGSEVKLMMFDNTVSMAKQIERIFESFETVPHYKEFSAIKIERKSSF